MLIVCDFTRGFTKQIIAHAIMTSTLLALAVAAANQENVDPSIDIIANVCSSARGVRTSHIDGSAKEARKRNRGPQSSDAEKIELLLCFIDSAGTVFALAVNVIQDCRTTVTFQRHPVQLKGGSAGEPESPCAPPWSSPGTA